MDSQELYDNIQAVLPLLKRSMCRLGVFNQQGLLAAHFRAMRVVSQESGLSTSQLAGRLGISKPNLTPIIDKLVLSGYVSRLPDRGDRRRINLIITAGGQAYLNEVRHEILTHIQDTLCRLPDEDQRALSDACVTIRRILEKVDQ